MPNIIEMIEFCIEQQDGTWPMSTSINLYKNDALSIWIKNDGDHINLHHAKRSGGLKSESWHVSEDQAMIMYLRGDMCLGTVWAESWMWKERVKKYLEEHELPEVI